MASVPNMRLGPTVRPGVADQPAEGGDGEGFAQLLSTAAPATTASEAPSDQAEATGEDRTATGGAEEPIAQADAILSLVAPQAMPVTAPASAGADPESGVSLAATGLALTSSPTNRTDIPTAAPAAGAATASGGNGAAPTLPGPVTAAAATVAPTAVPVTSAAPRPTIASDGAPVLTGPAAPAATAAAASPEASLAVRFAGTAQPAAGAPTPAAAATAGMKLAATSAMAGAASAPTPAQAGKVAAAATRVMAAAGAGAPDHAAVAASSAVSPRADAGRPAATNVAASTGKAAAPETAGAAPRAATAPAATSPAAAIGETVAAPAPAQTATPQMPPFSPTPMAEPLAATGPAAAGTGSTTVAEAMIERQLDLAADGEWLDRLARDIAGAGSGEGRMRFRLDPEHLGSLRVELAQSERGTSVRLIVESEAARAIIADAQPKLAAEARAQGVRIAETHVDLAGGQAGDSRRHENERRDPQQLRTGRESPDSDDTEPRTRSSSDRYA